MRETIKIKGARTHNLKNIDLEFPKNKMVCFTGVSGSGKSSLAFDTIYAEGQRRYVESLSTYARQFLGIMEKPDVDVIEGLSPAISIDQKTTSRNPRSTVGTVTEVYDYMRLLFARVGHPHCPICGREIASQTLDQIAENMLTQLAGEKGKKQLRFLILSPMVNDRKGEFSTLLDNLKSKGIKQVRVDNFVKNLQEDFLLIKTNKHTIEAVIDKVSVETRVLKDKVAKQNLKSRLTDSIRQALKLSEGQVILTIVNDKGFVMPEIPKEFTDHLFSERFACPVDNISLPEIEPRSFSFNSPHGACGVCNGLGRILKVEEELIFSEILSIKEGGILPFANMFENETWYSRILLEVCRKKGIDPQKPIGKLTPAEKDVILNGTGRKEYKVEGPNRFGRMTYIYDSFKGIIAELTRRHKETSSDYVRNEIEKYMRERVCPTCDGARLSKEALSVTINNGNIAQVSALSISQTKVWVSNLKKKDILSEREKNIGELILQEIATRLTFLSSVGLEYLTLDRTAGTLSGGEAQRIRLASQIGSGLTGVLYVLDEPTIGLHQRDNQKLIDTLKHLRDLGNTVVVVEHDMDMMKQSDFIVDFGPLAGKDGGEVVATGSVSQISKSKKSLTGKYLSGKRKIRVKGIPQELGFAQKNKNLVISGCTQFNLKNINVSFPLGKLNVITGVSGSGKSTLLVETVYPALKQKFNPYFRGEVGLHSKLAGDEEIDKVVLIDQSPIGRTPRSNPATYTKVFDVIRDVFSLTREAKAAGFKKGQFSFNVKGGRCEACEGQGKNKIEMQFMSDIWVTCEVCKGKRYSAQTLEITYRGKNIAEVLEMTVGDAKNFFHAHPKIIKIIETMSAVGLDYMELGQSATTLSGGEAQRVKLSTELAKTATGKTLYILDEPTTGLHFADLEKLLMVLKLLVAKGNTVIVIEHNIDIIRNADYIVDLGPDGGDGGGRVVAKGSPEQVKKIKTSYTGAYLVNN